MVKKAKIREDSLDREASLRRARQEASLADGISWGMGEDAVEEAEVCAMLQQKTHLDACWIFLGYKLYFNPTMFLLWGFK